MLHLWNSTVFFIQTGLKKNWKVLDWEFICNCRSKICINIRTGWGLRGKSLEDFSYQTFRFCSRGLSFSEETNISKCERGYALRAADKSQENVEAAAIKWKLISGRILQSTRCIDNAYLDWFSPHSLNSFFFFFEILFRISCTAQGSVANTRCSASARQPIDVGSSGVSHSNSPILQACAFQAFSFIFQRRHSHSHMHQIWWFSNKLTL